MKHPFSLLVGFGAFILAFFLLSSCAKDNSKYNLTVVVTANDTVHVSNAYIHLYAPVSGSFIDYYDVTNEQGERSYSFQNKVIVEIRVNKGSFAACSFAEVEKGSNTVVIDLKPFGAENGCQTSP